MSGESRPPGRAEEHLAVPHGHCTAPLRPVPSELAGAVVDGPVVGTRATDARPALPGPRPRRVWALAPKGSPPRG